MLVSSGEVVMVVAPMDDDGLIFYGLWSLGKVPPWRVKKAQRRGLGLTCWFSMVDGEHRWSPSP